MSIYTDIVNAEEFLRIYNYDRDTAAADGAEREFLEAEAIVEQERIDRYDMAQSYDIQQGGK